ncbi:MAG: fatty acid-binding protein, partial [Frondihabitans sp.]|nr:fatty acid-binding protein [Frondihabitans sp.]
RMYGLVENHLLWAWDIAALGNELRTHASGRLAHVD